MNKLKVNKENREINNMGAIYDDQVENNSNLIWAEYCHPEEITIVCCPHCYSRANVLGQENCSMCGKPLNK